MPVTQTLLTNNTSGTDDTSYATASISPTSGKTIAIMVHSRDNNTPFSVPTVTGVNMTWTQRVTKSQVNGNTGNTVTILSGVSDGTAGVLTISFATTQARIGWGVIEFDNLDTSGTNGADGFVQSATDGSNTGSGSVGPTLGAFSSADNATLAGFIMNGTNPSWTHEGGYTEIFDQVAESYCAGMVEFIASNDTSPSATMVMDEGTQEYAAVALELKFKASDTGNMFLVL